MDEQQFEDIKTTNDIETRKNWTISQLDEDPKKTREIEEKKEKEKHEK